jgi:hypothetical protein
LAHLTQHQIDALRRVEEAFLHDAREVEIGVPDGFGRHQVLGHLAGSVFRDLRVLVVVSHPARIAQAFESGIGGANGRRIGLILSDSDVEVASLSSVSRLARGGRLAHGAIVLDGLLEDQAGEADELVRSCGEAQVVRLRDAPDPLATPGGVSFPVRVVSSRELGGPARGP